MSNVLSELAEDDCKLEMTPMIDVTFLLLIFFMCTIKFKTLEGKLAAYLPKDVGVNQSEAEPKEKVDVRLEVLQEGVKMDPLKPGKAWIGEGSFRWENRVIRYHVGPRKTENLDTVGKWLKDYNDADPERGMTIDPRPPACNEDVMKVLDKAIQANFSDITFKGAPTK